MRVIIRPGTLLEGDADELTCNGTTPNDAAGLYADELARAHGIRGVAFTLKADGVELSRTTPAPADARTLELIEATLELDLGAPADEPDDDEA